jgi:hypothetical protein
LSSVEIAEYGAEFVGGAASVELLPRQDVSAPKATMGDNQRSM